MVDKELFLKGTATIKEVDPNTGEILSEEERDNIIVDNGATEIATALVDGSLPAFDYMGLGDGATAGNSPNETDTGLTNQQDISSQITPSRSNKKVTWENTFSSGAGKSAVTEIGMFDGSSGTGSDTMLNHLIFANSKDNENNDLQITYELTVS